MGERIHDCGGGRTYRYEETADGVGNWWYDVSDGVTHLEHHYCAECGTRLDGNGTETRMVPAALLEGRGVAYQLHELSLEGWEVRVYDGQYTAMHPVHTGGNTGVWAGSLWGLVSAMQDAQTETADEAATSGADPAKESD